MFRPYIKKDKNQDILVKVTLLPLFFLSFYNSSFVTIFLGILMKKINFKSNIKFTTNFYTIIYF